MDSVTPQNGWILRPLTEFYGLLDQLRKDNRGKPLIRFNQNAQRWETRVHSKCAGFPSLDVYEAVTLQQAVSTAYRLIREGRLT